MREWIVSFSDADRDEIDPEAFFPELIRCKDCRFWKKYYEHDGITYGLCRKDKAVKKKGRKETDYCSRAERIEEDDD